MSASDTSNTSIRDRELDRGLTSVLSIQGDFLQGLLDKIDTMEKTIQSLQIENRSIKDRMTYLEYDLHAERDTLKDKMRGWEYEPNVFDEDCRPNADCF